MYAGVEKDISTTLTKNSCLIGWRKFATGWLIDLMNFPWFLWFSSQLFLYLAYLMSSNSCMVVSLDGLVCCMYLILFVVWKEKTQAKKLILIVPRNNGKIIFLLISTSFLELCWLDLWLSPIVHYPFWYLLFDTRSA